MFERFNSLARRAVVNTQEEARRLRHDYIGTEHVLLGLIREGGGVATTVMGRIGISLGEARQLVEGLVGQGQQTPTGHIPFTPRAKKVLELSAREAHVLEHSYIGTEHLLLGLVAEGEGIAAQLLTRLGADLAQVRRHVSEVLSASATDTVHFARQLVGLAVAAKDHYAARIHSIGLLHALREVGREAEALPVLYDLAEYTRRAELGPWTQLDVLSKRFAVLVRLGQTEQALAEVEAVRDRVANLRDEPGFDEFVIPEVVREGILSTGASAACAESRWQQAVDLNSDVLDSMQRRNAAPDAIAERRYDNYWSLLELGRLAEVDTLLRSCQQVFADNDNTSMLGRVLAAQATLAARDGRFPDAVAKAQAALRSTYVRPELTTIAVRHSDMAGNLARTGTDPEGQVAHRLAAALLYRLASMWHDLAATVDSLADDLNALGERASIPALVAEVTAQVERVDGVRFGSLIEAQEPDPEAVGVALVDVLQRARGMFAEQPRDV